ncbi:hypothetical protein HZC35_02660 [Candidatus Saganbacteria bacterium]|nr:hypothetical protein [Candidatus Saganbacteria bacterium]
MKALSWLALLLLSVTVLNYPNPFNPAAGETTSIEYSLAADTGVTIYIFNVINQPVKRISCPSGQNGGRAGYNQVVWEGYTDFNELAANDAYVARVVSGGKQIGKCKIVVLR